MIYQEKVNERINERNYDSKVERIQYVRKKNIDHLKMACSQIWKSKKRIDLGPHLTTTR